MFRALVILGVTADVAISLLLLAVSGWVIDSWSDTRVPGTGMIVTTAWLIAFSMSAGSPLLAYALHKRKGRRVLLVLWLPALVLVTITVVGLILSPP